MILICAFVGWSSSLYEISSVFLTKQLQIYSLNQVLLRDVLKFHSVENFLRQNIYETTAEP